MNNKVIQFMHRHELIQRDTTVLVGVSGGPDSMALLHFYLSIRNEWNLNVIAISMDHQLRGLESKEDLQYVKDICQDWNIKFVEGSLDVKAYQHKKQVSTQVAARDVRYQFYSKQMLSFHADYLALGHHGDDQLETMLMSFARSTSTTALSGIPAKREFSDGYIVRPFLCLSKLDIMDYCERHGIEPRIDPSNEETDYTRNYFRKYIIPLIKEENNNIHIIAQRLSESLQTDEKYLEKKAKEMVVSIVSFHKKNNHVSFTINDFKSYPLSLQRRAYHLILNYLYHELPKNLSYTHEDIFFSLLDNVHGNVQVDFPNDLKIKRSYHQVFFTFDDIHTKDQDFHHTLSIPGKVVLPNGSVISAISTNNPLEDNESTFTIHTKSNIKLPLYVRTRKPGDRMSWKGLAGSKKIKDIFIDEKIPADDRDTWPIITDSNGKIIWLVGLKKAHMPFEGNEHSYIQLKYEVGKV